VAPEPRSVWLLPRGEHGIVLASGPDGCPQLRSAFGSGSLATNLSLATGAGAGVDVMEPLSLDGAGPLWVPCEPGVGACIEGSCAADFWVSAGAITAVLESAGAAWVPGLSGAAGVSLDVVGDAGDAGALVAVCAYTRPAAPTKVVAAIAATRVLEKFMLNLLGEERGS